MRLRGAVLVLGVKEGVVGRLRKKRRFLKGYEKGSSFVGELLFVFTFRIHQKESLIFIYIKKENLMGKGGRGHTYGLEFSGGKMVGKPM